MPVGFVDPAACLGVGEECLGVDALRREAWWISAMTSSSNPWRTERADGGRRLQQ